MDPTTATARATGQLIVGFVLERQGGEAERLQADKKSETKEADSTKADTKKSEKATTSASSG